MTLTSRLNSPAWKQRIEFTAAILISIATVFSAWCAYQSRLWSGTQAAATNAAGAARANAGRLTNEALTQTTVDVLLFEQYAVAYSEDNIPLAEFLKARFRDEFAPAFDAWMAADPLTNPDAPKSPFVMPEYTNANQAEADELVSLAEQKAAEATEANLIGSRFVLYTVLFAMVMFFGGISLRVNDSRVRLMLFSFAIFIFLIAIGFVLTSPLRLT
jgi:hypothetical protein